MPAVGRRVESYGFAFLSFAVVGAKPFRARQPAAAFLRRKLASGSALSKLDVQKRQQAVRSLGSPPQLLVSAQPSRDYARRVWIRTEPYRKLE